MFSIPEKVSNIVDYYAELLTIQYHNKTKAKATIEEITEIMLGDGLVFSLERAFDLDTAVGPALQWLGKYAGVKPVESYYIGGGYVTPTDEQLRILINIARSTNNTRSTYAELKRIIYENFADEFKTVDNKDMSIAILSNLTASILGQIAIKEKFFPIPACVGFRYYQVNDVDELFGYRTYESDNSLNLGFGTYTSPNGAGYFLSYSDNVII